MLEKTVKGKAFSGLRLINKDTIEMEIIIGEDKSLKIANTILLGNSIYFQNDADRDFIQDINQTLTLKPLYTITICWLILNWIDPFGSSGSCQRGENSWKAFHGGMLPLETQFKSVSRSPVR